MILSLTLKLLLAHFIGDFVLQPTKWVNDIQEKKAKSKYQYFHIAIHLVLLLIFLQFKHIWIIILIVVTHYIIDLCKLLLLNEKNHRFLFIADQLLHLLVIALAVYLIQPYEFNFSTFFDSKILLLATSIIFVTYVSAILIKILLVPYSNELINDSNNDSLKDAGRYIGILERLFVFGFILLQQWAAIGLLIAAKSVFRFGDLSEGKNRELTEYVLIGTLLSMGLAILAGLTYNHILDLL